jgi:hypothetical protein
MLQWEIKPLDGQGYWLRESGFRWSEWLGGEE